MRSDEQTINKLQKESSRSFISAQKEPAFRKAGYDNRRKFPLLDFRQLQMMRIKKIGLEFPEERIECISITATADVHQMIPPTNIPILISLKQLAVVVFNEKMKHLQRIRPIAG